MTSKGEKLFYLLSLVCVITGALGAATYIFYLFRGGQMVYGDTKMETSTLIIGTISFIVFRVAPGLLGWRGCKRRDVKLIKITFVLTMIAIVFTLGLQSVIPGVGTGWLVPGVYLIITFRYMRALTAEEREKDRKFIQKPEDGPRLQ